MNIEECNGYKSLVTAVESDEKRHANFHDYKGKLAWVVERAKHYAEKTGLEATAILDQWEKDRDYWYMNYYQECNQPQITTERCRVFETTDELLESIGKSGFRCPACNEVSRSPYECDVAPCDWKVYGLFGHMGKGISVFCKDQLRGNAIFMPIAWEDTK